MGLAQEDTQPFAARPRLDRNRGVLVGSRCPLCETLSWPARAVCNRCGHGSLELADLPAEGTLTSYTTVWVQRPGLDPPYVLGQVNLGNGARLFVHVRSLPSAAQVPMRVRVVVPRAESNALAFWYEPL